MVFVRDTHSSVPSPTLCRVQNPDIPDPGDAALRQLLASIAERTDDPAKKEFVLDFLHTMKPLAEWSRPERDILAQTCGYVISLARMSRELETLINGGAS